MSASTNRFLIWEFDAECARSVGLKNGEYGGRNLQVNLSTRKWSITTQLRVVWLHPILYYMHTFVR